MTNNEAKKVLENIWDFAISPDDCSGDILEKAIDVAIIALNTVEKSIPCYLGSPCEYQTEDVNHNHGWIPCSERLPNKEEYLKDDGRFIATDGNRVYQGLFDIYRGIFVKDYFGNAPVEDECVIAWRPLPSPYEVLG